MKHKRIIKYFFILLATILITCVNKNEKMNQNTDNQQKIDIIFPYELKLKKGKKELLVYGIYHTFDPNDSLFVGLKEKLIIFKPNFCLNEGGNWKIFDTETETIKKSGESGFIRYWCNENKILVKTFEPIPKEEFKYIQSKYNSNYVLLTYFCRQITQLQNGQEINDFEEYMHSYLYNLKAEGFPISDDIVDEYDSLIHLYENVFSEKFDWKKFNPKNVWPNYDLTILNKINKAISTYRDSIIIDNIEIAINQNQRTFVLMGGNHLLEIEQTVKRIFEETTATDIKIPRLP